MLKNLKIHDDVHILLKRYCLENHLKINDFASYILKKYVISMEKNICKDIAKRVETK
jgi:hypothetical protein